ncbi:hypothetical protein B0H12DRAFT_1240599 [Mycena haematopus]|nr:hypothetical protein B0H12DRAFT_1240599 [Mycena haematopus]
MPKIGKAPRAARAVNPLKKPQKEKPQKAVNKSKKPKKAVLEPPPRLSSSTSFKIKVPPLRILPSTEEQPNTFDVEDASQQLPSVTLSVVATPSPMTAVVATPSPITALTEVQASTIGAKDAPQPSSSAVPSVAATPDPPKKLLVRRNPDVWGTTRPASTSGSPHPDKERAAIMENFEARKKLAECENEILKLRAENTASKEKIQQLHGELGIWAERYRVLDLRTRDWDCPGGQEHQSCAEKIAKLEEDIDFQGGLLSTTEGDVAYRVTQLKSLDKRVEAFDTEIKDLKHRLRDAEAREKSEREKKDGLYLQLLKLQGAEAEKEKDLKHVVRGSEHEIQTEVNGTNFGVTVKRAFLLPPTADAMVGGTQRLSAGNPIRQAVESTGGVPQPLLASLPPPADAMVGGTPKLSEGNTTRQAVQPTGGVPLQAMGQHEFIRHVANLRPTADAMVGGTQRLSAGNPIRQAVESTGGVPQPLLASLPPPADAMVGGTPKLSEGNTTRQAVQPTGGVPLQAMGQHEFIRHVANLRPTADAMVGGTQRLSEGNPIRQAVESTGGVPQPLPASLPPPADAMVGGTPKLSEGNTTRQAVQPTGGVPLQAMGQHEFIRHVANLRPTADAMVGGTQRLSEGNPIRQAVESTGGVPQPLPASLPPLADAMVGGTPKLSGVPLQAMGQHEFIRHVANLRPTADAMVGGTQRLSEGNPIRQAVESTGGVPQPLLASLPPPKAINHEESMPLDEIISPWSTSSFDFEFVLKGTNRNDELPSAGLPPTTSRALSSNLSDTVASNGSSFSVPWSLAASLSAASEHVSQKVRPLQTTNSLLNLQFRRPPPRAATKRGT